MGTESSSVILTVSSPLILATAKYGIFPIITDSAKSEIVEYF
jgi:hypothetical protein